MTRKERVAEALRTMDFYELAKLTIEKEKPMNIKVKHIKTDEQLVRDGNRFLTLEQIAEEVRSA